MRLYVWFLFFLCCTRGWMRSFFAFRKALKIARPGDTIKTTTTLIVTIPERGASITVECAECGEPISEVKK